MVSLEARFVPSITPETILSVKMGTNRYWHFKMSHLSGFFTGDGTKEHIEQYMLERAKLELEAEFDGNEIAFNVIPTNSNYSGATELPTSLFDEAVVAAMKKIVLKSILMQTYEPLGSFHPLKRLIMHLVGVINKYVLPPINKLWALACFEGNCEDWSDPLLKSLDYFPYKRSLSHVSTISMTVREEDFANAINSLNLYLQKLKDIIVGSLLMPTYLPLVDLVGNGKKSYIIFTCFFLDPSKAPSSKEPGGAEGLRKQFDIRFFSDEGEAIPYREEDAECCYADQIEKVYDISSVKDTDDVVANMSKVGLQVVSLDAQEKKE